MSVRGDVPARPLARVRTAASARRPAWGGAAWGAIGLTLLFFALTCWWLGRDASVPYGDAGQDLYTAVMYHDMIRDGHFAGPFTYHSYYPPAVFLLGVLALFAGGVRVAAPVLAQNLVFLPLLALGCYHTGRLVFGRRTGLAAVAFALGAPLLIEQFHVFMLDAPQAAIMATAVWLILASDRFARTRTAVLAGAVVGIGIETKELFPLYLAGLVAMALLRDGAWRRNRRGFAAFAGVALLVGAPWYVGHIAELGTLLHSAGDTDVVPPLAAPPTLSWDNLTWYGWGTLNGLLYAPLFAFATVGSVAAVVRVVRGRRPQDLTPELLAGLGVAWLALTLMKHHDYRYTLPLIVYLSVLGTAWIFRLERVPRRVATALLAAAVAATTMGATFGIGGRVPALLPGNVKAPRGEGVPPTSTVVAYRNYDFLVSGPERDGDLYELFRAIHRLGIRHVLWIDQGNSADRWFNGIGLIAFMRMSGMSFIPLYSDPQHLHPGEALLLRGPVAGGQRACRTLSDGTGVWVWLAGRPGPDACPA